VATEVERKFVVGRVPEIAGDAPGEEIEQGYLALGPEGEVRLRRRGDARVLTVKRGEGLTRAEAETTLDAQQFDALWPLTEGRRVRKRRLVIPHGELEIELDVYDGELEGLMTAEIEFASEEEAHDFQPPDWLGDEVTGDRAYLNETLAVSGTPR
jgi:adenylate cyclase